MLEGKQKTRSPEEPRRLKPLGRSLSPLTANTPGRTYDSASVAPKASKKRTGAPVRRPPPARNLKWRNALGSIPLSIILPEPLQVRALLLHPGIYYTYHRLA